MGNSAVMNADSVPAIGGGNENTNKKATAVGASLRTAREGRNVSLDEASRATRIRKEFLVAIEEERFEVLPGDVFARGFVRSYAEYLGLDGVTIAARTGDRLPGASLPPPAGARETSGGRNVGRLLMLAMFAAAAAAAWWVQHPR